jgi:hypothetical protein
VLKMVLGPALKQFEQANNGQFPTALSQLQPYFDPPVDESILQRWEVAPKGVIPNLGVGATVITQVAPVDENYDTRYGVGPNGSGAAGPFGSTWTNPQSLVMPALQAYMNANNGQQPSDLSQLAPYATTPDQQKALQTLLTSPQPK